MKTYKELTIEQQKKAQEKCLNRLLQSVIEGSIRFNDELNKDELQAKIDQACQKAEKMKTPWFADEYVMEAVGEDLKGMAECEAEDSIYSESTDYVINGICD